MQRRWVLGLAALALVLAAAAPTLGAQNAQLQKPWTGSAVGNFQQKRHIETKDLNAADSYIVEDTQVYAAKLTFTFRVGASGAITGSGRGVYTKKSWTAKGATQGADGNPDKFENCQAPKTAKPFRVVVTGNVIHSRATLTLSLVNAAEVNKKDVACNKNFKLGATASHYLRDSLASVMKTPLRFNVNTKKPKFDPLTSHLQGKNDDNSAKPPTISVWVQDSTWTVKIRHP